MTNKEISRALRQTSDLIELTGGNPYRANAFGRAARTIRGLDESVAELAEAGTLTTVSGIGEGLAEQITDLLATGSFDLRDELLSVVPTGLLQVLKVKGLGTKKVRALWEELGVTSLDELDEAAKSGRVKALSGFGKKTQDNIIENVALLRAYATQSRYDDALRSAREIHAALTGTAVPDGGAFERVVFTGELRRKLETVSSIDLVVSTTASPDEVAEILRGADDTAPFDPDAVSTEMEADETGSEAPVVRTPLSSGLTLHLHVCTPDTFGTTLWQTTGSAAHCEAFVDVHGKPGNFAEEDDLFTSVGAEVIPPELRENDGEWAAATSGELPDLITVGDLKGTLHNHSTYSDGSHSLRQMADKAQSMGLSYFGICDHSQSLQVASGMKPDDVARQQSEIRELNESFGNDFRIFSGVESDILADGSLDYEDDVLASFDFIVASVHSGFNMTKEEATERVLTAVRNPYTSILGHPTGRLLLVREGYQIDHDQVIEACAKHNVAIELNANPYRLDLDWRYIHRAIDAGVLISINPDAHAMAELENVRWGIEVARKGWLSAENCLNARSLEEFAGWLAARQPAEA
jgi:DNA polymerase (family 10)